MMILQDPFSIPDSSFSSWRSLSSGGDPEEGREDVIHQQLHRPEPGRKADS